MSASRRDFLNWGLRAGALLTCLGGTGVAFAQKGRSSPKLPGYELLDVVPFDGDGRSFVGARAGRGPDARRAFDTSTLTSKKLITPNDEFFIRTGYPEHLEGREGWALGVQGLVGQPRAFPLADLASMAEPLGVHLAECAGSTRNSSFGLMSAADWKGVPVAKVLDQITLEPKATRILVSGIDPGGPDRVAGWIFALEDLTKAGAALALEMNGVKLPKDHGAPLRLIVPGWYACVWIKWVDRVILLGEECEPTPQMMEYATRTHQVGPLTRARDFRPAMIEQSAMPVRVEKWRHQGDVFYRVVGIVWGGDRPLESIKIGFDPEPGLVPVDKLRHETNATWTLWSHVWRPSKSGLYRIRLFIDEPGVRSWRMGAGFYDRSVRIEEV